jgi:S-adenosylmethionine:tRNA ribosyltransferase-isomerase
MHREAFRLGEEVAEAVRQTRRSGRRVVAVGTTCVRVLETCATLEGLVEAREGWTDLFILPGFRFRVVDALLTNFHLPRSTLLMLVSALAGRECVLAAYREAIRLEYRFYSFGDCMLVTGRSRS